MWLLWATFYSSDCQISKNIKLLVYLSIYLFQKYNKILHCSTVPWSPGVRTFRMTSLIVFSYLFSIISLIFIISAISNCLSWIFSNSCFLLIPGALLSYAVQFMKWSIVWIFFHTQHTSIHITSMVAMFLSPEFLTEHWI